MGHKVPQLKALRYGKYEARELIVETILASVRKSSKVPIYYINGALLILK